jgi:hypothetical protein
MPYLYYLKTKTKTKLWGWLTLWLARRWFEVVCPPPNGVVSTTPMGDSQATHPNHWVMI